MLLLREITCDKGNKETESLKDPLVQNVNLTPSREGKLG